MTTNDIKSVQIIATTKDGNYIKTFDSISQASKETDDSYIQIDRQIKTGIITKKVKYIWKTI